MKILAFLTGLPALLMAVDGSASAEQVKHLTIDGASIQYSFSINKQGHLHFCDFATTITQVPILVKLTSAFITDDTKAKADNLSVAYIVEAFTLTSLTGNPARDINQVKVTSGRIISDVFRTELHAVKAKDSDLGASYLIPSEGSLALFLSIITRGKFDLAVEFGEGSDAMIHVRPTPEIFDPSSEWMQCSIDNAKH